jgi:hypothetical protein
MTSIVIRPRANFLRLVEPPKQPDRLDETVLQRAGWQNTLFANDNPALIVVAEFDVLPVADFVTLLTSARPKFLFDLRRAPRFDVAHLNRRLAFDLFSGARAEYFDLSGRLGPDGARDVATAAMEISKTIGAVRAGSGPIVLLVDHEQIGEDYVLNLIEKLPPPAGEVWDVLKLPIAGTTLSKDRRLVFISHANPVDNNFAAWLSGKLAIAGYTVWSDVTKLVGGEVIWDDIEQAIRNHAAKVVVAISRTSQTRPGVLDEIDLAIRVERAENLKSFVLPIRIDNLPFSEVRANLARKNIIDFNRNWAAGLSSLLRVFERDRVPKTVATGAETLSRSLDGGLRVRATVIDKQEKLVSNWLLAIKLPDSIDLMDVSAPQSEVQVLVRTAPFPAFQYLRLLGTFSDPARENEFKILTTSVKRAYRIPLSEFLAGNSEVGIRRQEARNILANLLRQAWNFGMQARGLRSFEMASGQLAWFAPDQLIETNKVAFIDDAGKRRRKQLVGWSEKRQIFWHAAFEAKPVVGDVPRFVLRPHVIFTADGKTPLFSKQRMHVLRRSFCKSWWNDRWRDLLIAFTQIIGEDGEIRLPATPTEFVVFGMPMRVESTSVPEIEEATTDEDSDASDALDSDEEWSEEIFEDDPEDSPNEL